MIKRNKKKYTTSFSLICLKTVFWFLREFCIFFKRLMRLCYVPISNAKALESECEVPFQG